MNQVNGFALVAWSFQNYGDFFENKYFVVSFVRASLLNVTYFMTVDLIIEGN